MALDFWRFCERANEEIDVSSLNMEDCWDGEAGRIKKKVGFLVLPGAAKDDLLEFWAGRHGS